MKNTVLLAGIIFYSDFGWIPSVQPTECLAQVSSAFRQQLDGLVSDLNKTHPRYIRCIKPNGSKARKARTRSCKAGESKMLSLLSSSYFHFRLQKFRHKISQISARDP